MNANRVERAGATNDDGSSDSSYFYFLFSSFQFSPIM